MKFNDFLKETEDPEEKDDNESIPPEESEMNADEKEDMEDADEDVDEDDLDQADMDDENERDEDTSVRIANLLPQILSGTFKALEEVTIPTEKFLEDSGLEEADLQFWTANAQEIYPDLTHTLTIDGDNVVIKEVGVDEDEIEVDEIDDGEEDDIEDEDDEDEDSEEDKEDEEDE